MTKPDLARDVRQTEPPERHVPTGKRQHHGLYVVDECTAFPEGDWRQTWYSVISVALAERQRRRGGDPTASIVRHTYHGLPGLTWEAAQGLKRELRRTHER